MQRLRLEYWEAGKLADNPANYRKHSPSQVAALKGVLAEVGWAGALLYNECTGRLIDGHARKGVAPKGQKVPVLVGSWDEATERKILATYDPLGAMAYPDSDKLMALLTEVQFESPDVAKLLEALANGESSVMPNLADRAASGDSCRCSTCGNEHKAKGG